MSKRISIAVLDLSDELVSRLAAIYEVTAWRGRSELTAPPPDARVVPASMASACDADIVISAFPDDPALMNTVTESGGVLALLANEAIHVTIGLHGRTVIDRVSREHDRRSHSFVAAPLLLASAPAHSAAAVLGGDSNAIAKVRPVFDAMDISIVATCERAADAALLAIAHSAMVGCAMEAIAEAFALVRKFDVDARVLCDVMSEALFAGTVYGPLSDAMLADAAGHLPSVSRGLRILDLAFAAATSTRVPLASVDACRDRLLSAIAHGEGDRPWTAVGREQSRASGLP